MLWAAGVKFPVIPPGIIILLVGAVFVAMARWRWAPAVGVLLGAFITVGFLASPQGIPNITGDSGGTVAIGQAIEQLGVTAAIVAGVLALRAAYRRPRPAG